MMRKSVITSIATMMVTVASYAQVQPIPVDPTVRVGTLGNGMTYYIRPNTQSSGKANFCIARREGAYLQEGNTYQINNVDVSNRPSAVDSSLVALHCWADGQIASLPNQQAIVVAGDVDVETVENKIREIFASVPVKKTSKTSEQQKAAAFIPMVRVAKDENRTDAITYIYYKHDGYPREKRGDISYLFHEYKLLAVVKMMNARLQQIQQSAQVPFTSAQFSNGEFFFDKSKHSLTGQAISSEKDVDKTVAGLYREMLRAVRKGFSATEYEQARLSILDDCKASILDSQKTNDALSQDCLNHFLHNEPLASAESYFNLMQCIANHVSVKEVNQALREIAGDNKFVVFSVLPNNDSVDSPTEFDISILLAQMVKG